VVFAYQAGLVTPRAAGWAGRVPGFVWQKWTSPGRDRTGTCDAPAFRGAPVAGTWASRGVLGRLSTTSKKDWCAYNDINPSSMWF